MRTLAPPFLADQSAQCRTPFFFFFNDTATTEISPLSLHDALPIWIPRPFAQRLFRSCSPAGTKLNAYFRFGFQSGLLNFLHHSQPVISRQRDKSARYFDDVEADFFTLRDIAVYGVRPLREDMFDKPTRGYQHMVFVALRNQFFQYISGHQAKRSA